MPEPSKRYRKLPGLGYFGLGFSRNWVGEDHLLAVSSFLGVERYRRYYFKDIEAFIVRRTAARLIWNAVFAGAALISAILAGIIWLGSNKGGPDSEVGRGFAVFFGIAAAGCIALVAGNSLRGATCAVYIQTTSGGEQLPALLRSRTAERALRRLRPMIEAAQAPVISERPAEEASWAGSR
jgi:hypothetical protein